MTTMKWIRLAVAGWLLAAGAAWAAENPLPSPGFEGDNAKWWAIGDDSSKIAAEAAHSGSLGLRIGSLAYNPMGASVSSAKLPVAAGQEFTLTFWAKGAPDCCGVYLVFANAAGKAVSEAGPKHGDAPTMCAVNR